MERDTNVLPLREYLAVLRRQVWLVVLVTVLTMAAGLGWFFSQTPMYQTRSELVLEPLRVAQDISLNELLNPSGIVGDAEIAAAQSPPVAERAASLLDRDDPAAIRSLIDVRVVDGTQRLQFVATSADPQEAARVADAFASAFVEYRTDAAIESVRTVVTELDERAAELRTQIADVNQQLVDAGVPLEPPVDANGNPVQVTLSPEAETLSLRRQALQSQLGQVIGRSTELQESIESLTGVGATFSSAPVPGSPVGSSWPTAAVVSAIFGLLLGIGLAFLRDYFDDAVRDEHGLKRAIPGRPVLGRIPVWKPEAGKGATDRVASLLEPTSAAAEAYRELSAGVRFLLVAQTREAQRAGHHGLGYSRSVMICSATMGEGKTSTAANLAVATARIGLPTILVDADLRRSTVASRFGLPRGQGLSDALLNGDEVDDYLLDVGVENLKVLPAGTVPPNPTELLASPGMHALQRELLAKAELVIYDTPGGPGRAGRARDRPVRRPRRGRQPGRHHQPPPRAGRHRAARAGRHHDLRGGAQRPRRVLRGLLLQLLHGARARADPRRQGRPARRRPPAVGVAAAVPGGGQRRGVTA